MNDENKESPVSSVAAVLEHLRQFVAGERLEILNNYGAVGRIQDKQVLGADNCLLWMADELDRLDALLAAAYGKADRSLESERAERKRKAYAMIEGAEARRLAAERKAASDERLSGQCEL